MKIATSVVAVALLGACGGSTGSSTTQGTSTQSGNSQLSVSVTAPAASTAGATQTPAVVSRVRAAVLSVKLETADGDELGEINRGPFLVDLPAANLNGGLQQVFEANVISGTFHELDLDIGPATSALPGDLASQHASIIVDGTFNGVPFSFVTSIQVEVKKEGSFTFQNGATNVTIAFEPSAWFGTAAAPLDPNVATNRAAIEARIRASLTAFRDDDRNGHDDDVGDDRGQHDAGEPGDDRGGQQDAGQGGDDHGGQQDAGQGGDDHGQHDGGDDHGGNNDGGH